MYIIADWCNLQCLMAACVCVRGRQMWRRLPISVKPNMCHCASLGADGSRWCSWPDEERLWLREPSRGWRDARSMQTVMSSTISLQNPTPEKVSFNQIFLPVAIDDTDMFHLLYVITLSQSSHPICSHRESSFPFSLFINKENFFFNQTLKVVFFC